MFRNPFSSSRLRLGDMNGTIVHFNKMQLKSSHSEPQSGALGGGLALKRKEKKFSF